MPLCRPARVGLLVNRHQSHEAHQSADALLIHQLAFVTQMPCHLPDTEERRFQELLVDLPHQIKVLFGLALWLVVIG